MFKRILMPILLLAGCGSTTNERIVSPSPKRLQLGEKIHFVLDPAESSQIIKSGSLDLEVAEITEERTTIKGTALVDTIFGPKNRDIIKDVPNEILTLKFLETLRQEKHYEGPDLTVTYKALTIQACDELVITDITGYVGVTLEPRICVASATIPVTKVILEFSGVPVTATFKSE